VYIDCLWSVVLRSDFSTATRTAVIVIDYRLVTVVEVCSSMVTGFNYPTSYQLYIICDKTKSKTVLDLCSGDSVSL